MHHLGSYICPISFYVMHAGGVTDKNKCFYGCEIVDYSWNGTGEMFGVWKNFFVLGTIATDDIFGVWKSCFVLGKSKIYIFNMEGIFFFFNTD